MARLGGAYGRAHGLRVAQLAYHYHVGVLAHRASQRLGEAASVAPRLALVDERAFRLEDVFDGVLDRHDMDGAARVYLFYHRGERRRFAGAGWPRDEEQATAPGRQFFKDWRQSELFYAPHTRRDDAYRGGGPSEAVRQIYAQARFCSVYRDFAAKVELALVSEYLRAAAVELLEHQLKALLRKHRLPRRAQEAVDAHERTFARPYMDVARGIFQGFIKNLREDGFFHFCLLRSAILRAS